MGNNSVSSYSGRPSKLLLPPLKGAPIVVWGPLILTSTKLAGARKGL